MDGVTRGKGKKREEPASKHQIQPMCGDFDNGLTRDGTADFLYSRDQLPRHERGTEIGKKTQHFPGSADHEQDWQSSYLLDLMTMHTVSSMYVL